MQRRVSLAVNRVHICTASQQQLHS
jgi:hypothetical protein